MYVKDAELLSQLLGLPSYMVFKEEGSLSDICLMELANSVALPAGYTFSDEYRVPQAGDYFLDLEILTNEQRLVVYKSKSEGHNKKIIMAHDRSHGDYNYKKVQFNLDTCIKKDSGDALLGTQKVTLLSPYVDISGHVGVIDISSKRILIVHIGELVNLRHGSKHKNRLEEYFEISDQDKKFIQELGRDIFGLN